MQDKNSQTNASAPDPVAAASAMAGKAVQGDFVQKIVEKIKNSENILIALSRDPSVDEIAAAIGLTVFLDGMQKHATAIYSGRTPENLSFLQPDATFETNTDSLQDFIIALNKEKADHLRYKLEGDFVKVFITPYKTNITEDDLTFSHGDYNVDFVIAINVPSAGNLDEALREHGRIMHDASAVNITTGQPGRFGEIEWSNPTASSLCEMVTQLAFAIQGSDEVPLDKDVATALLAGIVAATDRFSNERTNPDTLGIASKLMAMGADQQLITSNIKGNEIVRNANEYGIGMKAANAPKDKTNLAVEHGAPENTPVRNPYAEGGPLAGTLANAQNGAANAGANPAAQVAPSLDMTANPEPAKITSETQNVTPDSVVVQPVIPGAKPTSNVSPVATVTPVPVVTSAPAAAVTEPTLPPVQTTPPPVDQMRIPGMPPVASATPSAAGVGVSMPSSSVAPSALAPVATGGSAASDAASNSGPRPMATSEPPAPTARQVGSTLQPPATAPKKTKNYAEMMEEALAEPLPGAVSGAANAAPVQPAVAATASTTMNLPNVASAPTVPAATPVMSTSTPTMEPVANPNTGSILPPPPAPVAGPDMMPPVLPPVQVPPEITN